MTIDTIMLIVAIILVLAIFIIELVQVIIGRKRPTISPITIILLVLVLLFTVFLTYRASELESADWAQIILMIALVAVTAFSTLSVSKQADASVKMAEEMKEQRYDALRPIIDIANIQHMPIELARQAYAKEPPKELACKLCNVGAGPATDVYSFVFPPSGERRRQEIIIGAKRRPVVFSSVLQRRIWSMV